MVERITFFGADLQVGAIGIALVPTDGLPITGLDNTTIDDRIRTVACTTIVADNARLILGVLAGNTDEDIVSDSLQVIPIVGA